MRGANHFFRAASVSCVLLSCAAHARGSDTRVEDQKATIAFLESLRDKETGAYKNTAKDKPSLRATNGAVKALKALGEKVTDIEKIQKFVLSRYDAKTGAFAEPDGKPDATITSIGIIVACEVGIEHKEFPKAMDYVLENAKEFEEVRIGAAAIEAWGVKGLKITEFLSITDKQMMLPSRDGIKDGVARDEAAKVITRLRLGRPYPEELRPGFDDISKSAFRVGQADDGGWRKRGEKASDIESSYRVMRGVKMLGADIDTMSLRKFLASHRNKDGGYGVKPGEASTAGGTYFAVIITKWLDEMEAKK